MSKKEKMVDGTPRRLCVPHSRFNGADGDWLFQVVWRTDFWKSIWNEHRIMLSYWPYIYAK